MKVKEGSKIREVRLNVKLEQASETLGQKSLDEFASKRSYLFFERLGLPTSFLDRNPKEWENLKDYKEALSIVKGTVQVTNDAGKRAVKLMKDYHSKFTNYEEKKQSVFQMVAYYRKKYPSINVSAFTSN